MILLKPLIFEGENRILWKRVYFELLSNVFMLSYIYLYVNHSSFIYYVNSSLFRHITRKDEPSNDQSDNHFVISKSKITARMSVSIRSHFIRNPKVVVIENYETTNVLLQMVLHTACYATLSITLSNFPVISVFQELRPLFNYR